MEELLKSFPSRRIKPVDGMAVTEDVWEEAFAYQREALRQHALFCHGAGIVTGLEVIASDPPDRTVYILPGIAIDPAGQTIVLAQPVAYDMGDEIEGFMYLLLSYRESRPRASGTEARQDDPLYVHHEFSIVARPRLSDAPAVELARLTREDRRSPLANAQNPEHPGPNEIDLRFRQHIGFHAPDLVTVAVSYLGETADRRYGQGAVRLARELNRQQGRAGQYHVVVDDDVSLDPGILSYTLIYLVGGGNLDLSRPQIKGLQGYVDRGGTLLIESCDPDAETVLTRAMQEMEIQLEPMGPEHPLLAEPFLFAAPPAGFDPAEVRAGGGVVYSQSGYGRLWCGERREAVPSREEIRSAMEWGTNLVAFAANRRAGAAG